MSPEIVINVGNRNTDSDQKDFASFAMAAGYQIEEAPEPDSVSFWRETAIAPVEFETEVAMLRAKAGEFHGQYDGWGCSLVLS